MIAINQTRSQEDKVFRDKKHHHTDVTNFIQLVSPQSVDQFSQTKLHWKATNKGYLHIYGIYKSDNK